MNKSRLILLAGDWALDIYEGALAAGLETNGVKVVPIKFKSGIEYYYRFLPMFLAEKVVYLEHRFNLGPFCWSYNRNLVRSAIVRNPDALFIYNARYVTSATIGKIRRKVPRCKIMLYTNDNPFGVYKFAASVWRHYWRSVPLVDHVFVYRRENLQQVTKLGAKAASVLMSSYLKGLHDIDRHRTPVNDLVFIGHFEEDGRLECLEALIEAGINVKIYGDRKSWARVESELIDVDEIFPVLGHDYVRALQSAKIALVFLSKKNKDEYTRRSFEIPAAGVLMLSEDTLFLRGLYEAGEEALYFTTKEECVKVVREALNGSINIEQIALRGKQKVVSSGHSNLDRALQIIKQL